MAKAKKAETKSVISKDRAEAYETHTVMVGDEKVRVIDNGDTIAKRLRGKTEKELEAIAKDAGVLDRWKGWAHLNAGMRRMNLGNVLRGGGKSKKAPAKAKKAAAPRKRKAKSESTEQAAA